MGSSIRPRTVSLIAKLLRPLTDEGLLSVAENREIIANLRHLATKGTMLPAVAPRLITQEEVADMLGIGISNWKKMEREGRFPGIKRRMVGSAVRYRNTDVYAAALADDEPTTEPEAASSSLG
jgi:predicted DNA-binding transcriptional regulator AlpA